VCFPFSGWRGGMIPVILSPQYSGYGQSSNPLVTTNPVGEVLDVKTQ
jgi:hypothetical protein